MTPFKRNEIMFRFHPERILQYEKISFRTVRLVTEPSESAVIHLRMITS